MRRSRRAMMCRPGPGCCTTQPWTIRRLCLSCYMPDAQHPSSDFFFHTVSTACESMQGPCACARKRVPKARRDAWVSDFPWAQLRDQRRCVLVCARFPSPLVLASHAPIMPSSSREAGKSIVLAGCVPSGDKKLAESLDGVSRPGASAGKHMRGALACTFLVTSCHTT